ncbi:hypothetical protein SY88_09180 [Clostridiales bacterium PH28_bin88]|nr:hypothetical protein SY88_09180 [Clostridiales bacterium PH28_bin88]
MHPRLAKYLLLQKMKSTDALRDLSRHSFLFVDWHLETQKCLEKIFGEGSAEAAEFKKIRFQPRPNPENSYCCDKKEVVRAFQEGLAAAKATLESAAGRVERCHSPGTAVTKYKAPGKENFVALANYPDEAVLLEMLLCRADIAKETGQLPEEERERLNRLVAEVYDQLISDRPNTTRLRNLSQQLSDLLVRLPAVISSVTGL